MILLYNKMMRRDKGYTEIRARTEWIGTRISA